MQLNVENKMSHKTFHARFWKSLLEAYKCQIKATKPKTWKDSVKRRIKLTLCQLLGRPYLTALRYRYPHLNLFLSHFDELYTFHSWLADEHSKALLVELLVRKILGGKHLPSLIDNDEEEGRIASALELVLAENTGLISMGATEFVLSLYDLSPIGYSVKAHVHPLNVVCTFMSEQYRYSHGNVDVSVQNGDAVIDAGGCWGDTALYFAARGAERVLCFEFVEENLDVLRKNLLENPPLAQRISVVEQAVWSEDGVSIQFDSRGPGTRVGRDENASNTVKTITIDTFVERENLDHVDFIKMDIEGTELNALEGAKQTIKRFGPKLAITVYHKPDDLLTIPYLIKEIRPDYQLYLDHFTTTMWETVLFAIIPENGDKNLPHDVGDLSRQLEVIHPRLEKKVEQPSSRLLENILIYNLSIHVAII